MLDKAVFWSASQAWSLLLPLTTPSGRKHRNTKHRAIGEQGLNGVSPQVRREL